MTAYVSLPIFEAKLDQRLRLVAGRCDGCATLAFPRRNTCLSCAGDSFTLEALSGKGTIYSYTMIAPGVGPSEFDEQQAMTGSLAIGVIDLAEGPRFVAQIVNADPAELYIGRAVRAVVRRLYDQEGVIRYAAKFIPVRDPATAEHESARAESRP